MYEIIVQRAVCGLALPTTPTFKRWVKTVLKDKMPSAEVTIRIVDKNEMTELNATYRKKNKPTNVLSFPFDMPDHLDLEPPVLGDIVICAEVILEEASAQQKAVESHWAHMVVHGTLHLLGYDHEKNDEAEIMEAEEIRFLSLLGYDNPYSD